MHDRIAMHYKYTNFDFDRFNYRIVFDWMKLVNLTVAVFFSLDIKNCVPSKNANNQCFEKKHRILNDIWVCHKFEWRRIASYILINRVQLNFTQKFLMQEVLKKTFCDSVWKTDAWIGLQKIPVITKTWIRLRHLDGKNQLI